MNQHDFQELFQTLKQQEISSNLSSLRAAASAAESRRLLTEDAQDRVFTAFEEFQLIQRNLHTYPLWAALRLTVLHQDLQGRLHYLALTELEPYVPTDNGLFPFLPDAFGPIEQTDLKALEYKELLSKLKTGIPDAVNEVLTSHPEVKLETLTGVIKCLGAAETAAREAEDCKRKNTAASESIHVAFLFAGLFMFGFLGSIIAQLWPAAVICAIGTFLFLVGGCRDQSRTEAEGKKAHASLITTRENKLQEAIALVKGGPSPPPPTPAPQSQLPAPTAPPSPPPAQAPKPRRTEPTALCSNCQQRITFPAAMAGQTVACPSCGAQTTLDDVSDVLTD